jgi:FeS assembly protein IscX
MRWTDIHEIAIALDEAHPTTDILGIRFTDLHRWVLALEGFEDAPEGCNEKILEAIQMAWFDERL